MAETADPTAVGYSIDRLMARLRVDLVTMESVRDAFHDDLPATFPQFTEAEALCDGIRSLLLDFRRSRDTLTAARQARAQASEGETAE